MKGLEKDASDGPLKPLDFTDEFYWNYRDFQNSIEEACNEMEYYEIKCEKLKSNIEAIKSEARRDWSRVKGNVYSSDDEANKSKVFADNEQKWDEFIQVADRLYDEAYQLYCMDNTAGSDNSSNSANPFDGAAASGTATNSTDEQTSNSETSFDESTDEDSASNNKTRVEENTSPQAPPSSTLVGSVFTKNGGGKYRSFEVSKLKTNDRIVFQKVSGDLNYIQLIWRKEGGIWETAYEGPKTEIRVGDLIPKMPARTTHLNFVVNTHHNHWSAKNPDCEMNVYIVHGGGSSIPTTKPSENTNPQHPVNPKPKVNPKPNITPTPQAKPNNTPTNNSVNKQFSELLTKANEEFNKKYWEEGNGPKASSNPKQASLDLLRRASRLINSEPVVEKRYDMVLSLTNLSTRFAQRVFAYENKIPFINLAGEIAGRAGSQVSGIQNPDPTKKKELQKYAYSRVASAWKCVRDAALMQGGNYTPETCDREYLKYKSLSEK